MNEKPVACSMAAYRLTLMPGDGTGREVIEEVKRVLSVFQDSGIISLEITEIPCGGQHYLETGEE